MAARSALIINMIRAPVTQIGTERAAPGSNGRRKTVAVLFDHMDLFGGGCEVGMREALQQTCTELDLDLLLVYGRALGGPDPAHAIHNSVFELIQSPRADGLVIFSTALSTYTGPRGISELFERSGIAARCSAGLALPGTPSIVIDNLAGMAELLTHVLSEHGYRRPAFIGGVPGNPDAEARFATYKAALARAGIAYDPRRVAFGNFVRRSGDVEMTNMLARGERPDLVVAANDGMALGAIAALERQGLRVPEDVAVTGFDDLSMARLNDPPLTTVAQPLREMLARAVRCVARQLSGEAVELVVPLPTQLVVRESCGCGAGRHIAPPQSVRGERLSAAYLREHAPRILERMFEQGLAHPSARADAEALCEGVAQHLEPGGTSLLGSVKAILRNIGEDNERRQAFQISVGLVRSALRPLLTCDLEDRFHEVHEQVGLTSTRVQVQQRLEIDQAYSSLMERGERFSNLLDLPGLQRGLERHLPSLGMHTVFMAAHAPNEPGRLLPVVCLVDGVAAPVETRSFPAHELFPPGLLEPARRRTLLVFPLVLAARSLGVAVFEYTPGTNGYVVVRDRVSVALGCVELHQTIVLNTTLHERNLREQQRLANEERIRSLNVLAGGVAHDLNNAINPLLALPDVLLEEIAELERDAGRSVPALRSDLLSIKSSALRASRTITDLLTMSRQTLARRETLDLNETIQKLMNDLRRQPSWSADELDVQLDLHREPLPLLASEAHLQRALSNLVQNAVEAMDQRGRLMIETGRRFVAADEASSEGVREGWYGTVAVADNGRGISEANLQRIFEPFFSSKPMNDRSGSGLGLAIVDGITKNHGGFVRVQSRLGAGTCFTLHFPIHGSRPAQKINSTQVLTRGSGRILIVDDDPVQLRTARRLLEHFGYAVDAESSGLAARARFDSAVAPRPHPNAPSPYDLVILDMQLNEADDGVQVYRRILERFPEQRAIISSGHACPESAAKDVPADLLWLPKPYTAQALADAVKNALDQAPASDRPS